MVFIFARGCFPFGLLLGVFLQATTTSGLGHSPFPQTEREHGEESNLEFTRRLFKKIPTTPSFKERLYNHPDPFGEEISTESLLSTLVTWIEEDEINTRTFLEAVQEYRSRKRGYLDAGSPGLLQSEATKARDNGDEGYDGCVKDYTPYIEPVVDRLLYPLLWRLRERCIERDPNFIDCDDLKPEPPAPSPDWAAPCTTNVLKVFYPLGTILFRNCLYKLSST